MKTLCLLLLVWTMGFTGVREAVAEESGRGGAFTINLRGRPEWNEMRDVRAALGPRVLISERTVDLRGGRLSGKALKHPRNRQDERSVGLRIRIKGFTLKNGYVEDIPGGVIVMAPQVTLQNLTFNKGGEDFVSNEKDRAEGFRVLGCRFYNRGEGDKSIQANDGRGLVIRGNFIYGGTTAIRIQKKDAKKQGGTAIVESNVFEGMDTAINAAGKVTVLLGDNQLRQVATEISKDGSGVRIVRRRR